MVDTVARRMTDEEADAWRVSLTTWIAKYHPHLANREEQWKEWEKSARMYSPIQQAII